jgi:amiloride-sensitive sodium channel
LKLPQIPFPSITICPESKFDTEKFDLRDVLDKIYNNQTLTQEEVKRYEAAFHVCNIPEQNAAEPDCKITKILREISTDFWTNSTVGVANIDGLDLTLSFRQTVTRHGICYTSNSLSSEDMFKSSYAPYLKYPKGIERSNWTSFGYDNQEPFTYPKRIFGSGKESGMKITLKMKKKDVNFACKSSGNGFRVSLHTPNELPQLDSNSFGIPFDVETSLSVDPKVMTTANELKSYKPMKRQCYFPGEERLEFFKQYTQMNCKIECFTSEFTTGFQRSSIEALTLL